MLATIGIIAGGGFTPAGILISTFCQSTSGNDAGGVYFDSAWTAVGVYTNGTGGTYNSTIGDDMNGCFRPAGYITSYEQYDSNISWSHGTSTGIFTYGYSYNQIEANGSGGYLNSSESVVTAINGQVLNEYTENDGATGYLTRYILYFQISNTSLQNTSYIVAGTLIGSGCTTLHDYPDAKGLTWTVGVQQYQYADGVGGYYYTYQINVYECGYLPSGYWTQYDFVQLNFYWYDQYNAGSTFYYGKEAWGYQADGMGNTNYLNDGITLYYAYGYIFYSYHDVAGQQTINYAFDGVSGYVVQYVMD